MKLKFCLIIFLSGISGVVAGQNAYRYTVDLTKVVDDKVFVELTAPKITSADITFYLPKIIPGTYAIADYGRFVSDFKAVDKKGKSLTVTKLDENSWKITNATALDKISYWKFNFPTTAGPAVTGTEIQRRKIKATGFI